MSQAERRWIVFALYTAENCVRSLLNNDIDFRTDTEKSIFYNDIKF
jgi:hypothetical protein